MDASPNQKIAFADTLRGLACLSVVVAHLVVMFALYPNVVSHLTGIEQATPDSKPIAAFNRYCPINFGGFGVGLFFIISGFVIPLSVSRLNRIPFAIARFFRIVPTYAAALALTIATLSAVHWCFDVPYVIPWRAALAHIAFVRDVLWLPSIDGVAWTLEVEMKYYLVCMIVAPMLVKHDVHGLLLLGAVMTAAVLWLGTIPNSLAGENIRFLAFLRAAYTCSVFLNLMWIGTVLSFHWHGQCSTRTAAMAIAAFAVMFALQMPKLTPIANSQWVSIATTYVAAIGVFLLAYARPHWFSGSKTLAFVAKISYPLYVVHGVIGYAVEQLLCSLGVNIYLAMASTIALMIGVATLVHRFIELPTHEFGRKLARRVQEWQSPKTPIEREQTLRRMAA